MMVCAALLGFAPAWAWPGDLEWGELIAGGGVLVDDADDMVDYNSPPWLDLVGDGVASTPAGYWHVDEASLSLRFRLDADPGGVSPAEEGSWVALLETDGDLTTYEFSVGFASDGAGGGWLRVYSNATQTGGANDPAENLIFEQEYDTEGLIETARVVASDSSISLDADAFLDVTLAWSELESASAGVFHAGVPFRIALATAEDAGDAAAVDVDLAGPAGEDSFALLDQAWTDAVAIDGDGDGLLFFSEAGLGTDPWDADSDEDGLGDGEEALLWASDPLLCDSDADGLADGLEAGVPAGGADTGAGCFGGDADPASGTDPLRPDTDSDGRLDGLEDASGDGAVGVWESDPLVPDSDSDGDGIVDAIESQCHKGGAADDRDADGAPDGEEGVDGAGYLLDGDADGLPDFCDPLAGPADTGDSGEPADSGDPGDSGDPADSGDPQEDTADPDIALCDMPFLCAGELTGGSCASLPGGAALAPALLALLAVLRRRRAAGALLLAAAAPAAARAQGLDAQGFAPSIDGHTFTRLDDSRVGLPGPGGGVLLNYADDPLVYRFSYLEDTESALLSAVGTVDVLGFYNLRRVRLGADVPLHVFAEGYELPGGHLLGDIRLEGKVELLDRQRLPLGVALAAQGTLPTGAADAWLGAAGPTVGGRAILTAGDAAVTTLHLGYVTGGADISGELAVGGSALAGLGLAVPLDPETWISAELSSRKYLQAEGALAGLSAEALTALHVRPVPAAVLTFGSGLGLTRGIGSPDFRVVAGLAWSPQRAEPTVAGGPDLDGDSVADAADRCPDQREELNGVDDLDGCPDNGWTPTTLQAIDPAGALVAGARIELLEGPLSGEWIAEGGEVVHALLPGRYTLLANADGYLPLKEVLEVPADRRFEHRIRMEKERPRPGRLVIHVFDGAGEPLDASVRVLGSDESTAAVAGVVETLLDVGTYELLISAPGHRATRRPVTLKPGGEVSLDVVLPSARVSVGEHEIRLFDRIFFELDSDGIQAVSFSLLDELAATLQEHPEIELVEIQGHTDATGSELYNLALSQRRAEAVARYLAAAGVDSARLLPRGYGEGVPLREGDHEANRRVEFHILRRQGVAQKVEP